MSKLYFKYSTMNAGKSLNLISTAYSFKERSIPYIVMKPVIDTRDTGFIKSRALNTKLPCENITEKTDIYMFIANYIRKKPLSWILIDECQFLSEKAVNQLAQIVDTFGISIITYGFLH